MQKEHMIKDFCPCKIKVGKRVTRGARDVSLWVCPKLLLGACSCSTYQMCKPSTKWKTFLEQQLKLVLENYSNI